MILVDAQGLAVSRPDKPLFADLSVTVSTGDRVGVVGINGCGKSTLLRVLAGQQSAESGVVRRGRGARIGILEQDPVLPATSVRAAVGEGWRGEAVLDRLGMSPNLDDSTDELSGGQRKRVALARLLVHEHDLLILDEPTNHLDLDAIAFLEEWLAAFRGGLLLVTHDRHLLDAVTTSVLELDRGRTYLHVPSGVNAGSGYAAYLAGRAEREQQAATSESVRRNLARAELAWLRRGAPARTSKPKARIAAATAIVEGRADAPARRGDMELGVLGTSRLGSQAVELHGVGFMWPDGSRVLSPFDHSLEPGDRLGIVGPNGIGKSTLMDLIAGRREPTEGRVVRGRTVKVGYYDQLSRDLPLDRRVRDVIAGDKAEPTWDDIRLMERFWFDSDAQFAPIGTLSGGERRRLQLVLTLLERPNVLLLDEPTNDLDLDTLRALEDLLSDWPGLLVVVSHDRAFLDRTVTDVMAIDAGGTARLVRGGVAGWLAERSSTRGTRPSRETSTSTTSTSTTSAASGHSVPATSSAPRRPARSGRSPSTLRRLLTAAERRLADADAAVLDASASYARGSDDHREIARLAEVLAAKQVDHAAAEHAWLEIASEMEEQGLIP
jgi:ABC transport system ATP-binding/permease protein